MPLISFKYFPWFVAAYFPNNPADLYTQKSALICGAFSICVYRNTFSADPADVFQIFSVVCSSLFSR